MFICLCYSYIVISRFQWPLTAEEADTRAADNRFSYERTAEECPRPMEKSYEGRYIQDKSGIGR